MQPPPAHELLARDFVQQVADHLSVERAGASPAIDAVPEMLGRRISHGEVDDLVARLPAALAGPLLPRAGESESAVAVQVVELVALVG